MIGWGQKLWDSFPGKMERLETVTKGKKKQKDVQKKKRIVLKKEKNWEKG